MKNIAIYAGTFDPITFGHIDLLDRASAIFDQIIVAVAANVNKKPLFDLTERVALAKAVMQHHPNVSVQGFEGLLLDFAVQHDANVILRGLRTVTDFDYEFQLASMNRHLNSKIETMFLMPSENFMYISASLVREIATLGGDVSGFVPAAIATALKAKIANRGSK